MSKELFRAIYQQNYDAVYRLVLEEDLNCKNPRSHDTPLHAAIKGKSVLIARAMWQNGADPNAKNKQGLTPFALACKRRNYEITLMMIRDLHDKVDYKTKDNDGNTCLHYFRPEIRNNYQMLAEKKKNFEVLTLRALLYYGVRGIEKNKNGDRALPVWPPTWKLSLTTVRFFPRSFTESQKEMESTLKAMKLPDMLVYECIDRASQLSWE